MLLRHPRLSDRDHACSVLDCLAAAAPTEAGRPGEWVYLNELRLGSGYDARHALGLLELPAALGALELNRSDCSARVTSVSGGYLLRLLSDLLDCGAPIVADWESEGLSLGAGHPFGRATDLLAALELRRRELLPGAAPVRNLDAALGLLVDLREGERLFLLCYDEAARAWQLPGGRYENRDRSLRATLLRELEEELGCGPLREPDDLLLHPLGQPLSVTRLSPTLGLLTRTKFHLFLVRPARPLALDGPGLRWLSEAELRAGRTLDDQAVEAGPLLRLLEQPTVAAELAALGLATSRPASESALALGV